MRRLSLSVDSTILWAEVTGCRLLLSLPPPPTMMDWTSKPRAKLNASLLQLLWSSYITARGRATGGTRYFALKYGLMEKSQQVSCEQCFANRDFRIGVWVVVA